MHSGAMNNLANRRECGSNKQPCCSTGDRGAVQLYKMAIEEEGYALAMAKLVNLLQAGAEGVPADPVQAVQLYNRAITEGGHDGAMLNLANLLTRGAPGVAVDTVRAVQLYSRAFEEGQNVTAMSNLAVLRSTGAVILYELSSCPLKPSKKAAVQVQ